jgi:hypothetical protein
MQRFMPLGINATRLLLAEMRVMILERVIERYVNTFIRYKSLLSMNREPLLHVSAIIYSDLQGTNLYNKDIYAALAQSFVKLYVVKYNAIIPLQHQCIVMAVYLNVKLKLC